jgi:hypothetical protein
VLCLLVSVGSAGCTTELGSETARSSEPVVAQRFARLSHLEWEQTVVDLFELPGPTGLSESLASDALGGKLFDNHQAALGVSPPLWSDYRTAAEAIAERVTSDPQSLARLRAGSTARAFIQELGLKAYRRPLAEAEMDAYSALFQRGPQLYPGLDPFVAGARSCIAAFLQSPHFIFREDLAPTQARLDGWAIASRLSYALWHSMPDAELRRAAAAGELDHAAGLQLQIERLLASPRAVTGIGHFFEQLYQTNQYRQVNKSLQQYPAFTPALGADMQLEATKFMSDQYERGGGLRQLLTSTTSFVTPALAATYGLAPSALPAADSSGVSRVELDPAERAGLLTRSGFLAWKAGEAQPNSIQRGVFILRRILCQPLGNPPPSAQGKSFGIEPTNRKRVEALTGAGTCAAACHARYINPLGFGLEHFGALGEYRTVDAGEAIDSSGRFAGTSGELLFRDAVELSRALAESPQAHACYSSYLLEYLLGREPSASDTELAAELARRSLSGAPTRELLAFTVASEGFRDRPTLRE